jgi:hypothetical protein
MIATQYIVRYGLAGLHARTGIAKFLDVPAFVPMLSTSQALPPWALRPVALAYVLADISQCWRETIAPFLRLLLNRR